MTAAFDRYRWLFVKNNLLLDGLFDWQKNDSCLSSRQSMSVKNDSCHFYGNVLCSCYNDFHFFRLSSSSSSSSDFQRSKQNPFRSTNNYRSLKRGKPPTCDLVQLLIGTYYVFQVIPDVDNDRLSDNTDRPTQSPPINSGEPMFWRPMDVPFPENISVGISSTIWK